MKIIIYNEPCRGALGGSEVSAAVMAEALAREHEVEILHYRPSMTRAMLENFAAVDLSRVTLRLGTPLAPQKGVPWKVVSRLLAEQRQEEALTAGADVVIAFVHEVPLFHRAKLGVLVVLFPVFSHGIASDGGSAPGRGLQRAWYRWKLGQRLRRYRIRLCNSEFTAGWTKRRWKIDCGVLYPPIELQTSVSLEKENLVLSVGRFGVHGTNKHQLELLQAYRALAAEVNGRWRYSSVGACGSSASDEETLARARAEAGRSGAEVKVNLSRAEVEQLYARARIFWHAAGLEVDETKEPERTEHFGMTTVEAMAYGCVPIVINKGGQREIVEHGVSGFLWNNPGELQEYTKRLIEDDRLWQRMSAAARARAHKFSRQAYVDQTFALLETHLRGARVMPAGGRDFAVA